MKPESRFTEEERGIIRIYGEVIHSKHPRPLQDTAYLEKLVLAEYDRATATTALRGLLEKSGSRRKLAELQDPSIGEMMALFIQSRLDRWR